MPRISLNKRELIAGSLATVVWSSSSIQALTKVLDIEGLEPKDVEKTLLDRPYVSEAVNLLLRIRALQEKPYKALKGFAIGIAQHAVAKYNELSPEGKAIPGTEITKLRKQAIEETKRLIAKGEDPTPVQTRQHLIALLQGDRAGSTDDLSRYLREVSENFDLVGKFANASKSSKESKKGSLLALYVSVLSWGTKRSADVSDRTSVTFQKESERYADHLLGISHHMSERAVAKAKKTPATAAKVSSLQVFTDPLAQPDIQKELAFSPGPASVSSLESLPAEIKDILREIFKVNDKSPEESAEAVNSKLSEAVRKTSTELANAVDDSEAQQRTYERRLSNISGSAQLAGIFIGEVLKRPDIGNAVSFAANQGVALYVQTAKFLAESGSKSGASTALTALTGNYITFGLALVGMFASKGPTPEKIMLEQMGYIREDIGKLYDVVQQGFVRLEKASIEILERLDAILQELDTGFGNIQSALEDLQTSLLTSRGDDLNIARSSAAEGFDVAVTQFDYQLAAYSQRRDRSAAPGDFRSSLSNIKGAVVPRATKAAFNFVYSGSMKTSLADVVDTIKVRKDPEVLTGVLSPVLKFLGEATDGTPVPNPEVWYEAVSAYVYMVAATLDYATSQDDQTIEELYRQGKKAADFINSKITVSVLEKAATKYLLAVDMMAARVGDLFLEKLSVATKDAYAGIYGHISQFHDFDQNPQDSLDAALMLGVVRLPDNNNKTLYEQELFAKIKYWAIEVQFQKLPGNWSGLSVSRYDYFQEGRASAGFINYHPGKKFEVQGINHGVALHVARPTPVPKNPLPRSEGRTPLSLDLSVGLPNFDYERPFIDSKYGDGGIDGRQQAETRPTLNLYRAIADAVDLYAEGLRKTVASEIAALDTTKFEKAIDAVENAAFVLEFMHSLYAYRLGEHRQGVTWARVMRAQDYLPLTVALMEMKSLDRLKFVNPDLPFPADQAAKPMTEIGLPVSLSMRFNEKSFNDKGMQWRNKVSHKDLGDGLRIDNYLVSAFRKAATESAKQSLPNGRVGPKDSVLSIDRGLAELAFIARLRDVKLA